VLLLALVGWCVVHETMKQTQARYALAEAARTEEELLKRLEKLKAREESLLQPARLAAIAKELKLEVANLGTVPPADNARPRSAMAAGSRRNDGAGGGGEGGVRVAAANHR
jgi:hypothetical protein